MREVTTFVLCERDGIYEVGLHCGKGFVKEIVPSFIANEPMHYLVVLEDGLIIDCNSRYIIRREYSWA